MWRKTVLCSLLCGTVLCLFLAAPGFAKVQYSNDFEKPSSSDPSAAWPEWVSMSTGGPVAAVNGRIEWTGSSNHWLRLDKQLPKEYVIEYDFFYQEAINGRFSFWPLCGDAETDVFNRHNYFMRKNTHYFNGADTVPSEGPRDLTLPMSAVNTPHRIRAEVKGDHIILLYKDKGQGGFIKIDERDFPAFGDGSRYVQLGFNLDSAPAGLIYIDNFVVSYSSTDVFTYENNFDNPANASPSTAWPELVSMSTGGPVAAINGRIEWTGSSNHWLRLDKALPKDYVVEYDFFYQENINGRFSFWPLCGDAETDVFNRHNYFMRKNTHYFNGADTVPSEGPRDLTLPMSAVNTPHRIRAEVSGDHVILLYKDKGQGGFIKIDERDFPAFGDGSRYTQLGFNLDSTPAGLIYIDNLSVKGLSANRIDAKRSFSATNFEPDKPIAVTLNLGVSGSFPVLTVLEACPLGWVVSEISDAGVVSSEGIIWSFKNLSAEKKLTYKVTPPRLTMNRVAQFAGIYDSGDGAEPVGGDTLLSVVLPYLYREAIDYDFSGSPASGKNYPTGYELGKHYAQDKVGVTSDVVYKRPTTDDSTPAVDAVFTFPANGDFHQGNPAVNTSHGASYTFAGYRDDGVSYLEHGASDTGSNIGSIGAGDWFRYSFDLGEGDQVLILNLGFNTWHTADSSSQPYDLVDIYVDNKFKGEVQCPISNANEFLTYKVGPFKVNGGVHSIVAAFPSNNYVPSDFSRMEVVRVKGIGEVSRKLTADGFFDPAKPLQVTLNAKALYGLYTPYIEETIPPGSTVTQISDGGILADGKIIWSLPATQSTKAISYTVTPPSGSKFLIFKGACDNGLPIADQVYGDTSVTNQAWLFGAKETEVKTDDFAGTTLKAPWKVEFGSDPALSTDYKSGVEITYNNTIKLSVNPDDAAKFDEYSAGRRAPMILRTDIPDGDWRMEADVKILSAWIQTSFATGLVVSYGTNNASVSGDEYIFGFYQNQIQVELTNVGSKGTLAYQNLPDEAAWLDSVDKGNVNARFGVTKRGEELVFTVKLATGATQLIGAPVTEKRKALRVGFYTKVWTVDNAVSSEFDNFKLSTLDAFTPVENWELF